MDNLQMVAFLYLISAVYFGTLQAGLEPASSTWAPSTLSILFTLYYYFLNNGSFEVITDVMNWVWIVILRVTIFMCFLIVIICVSEGINDIEDHTWHDAATRLPVLSSFCDWTRFRISFAFEIGWDASSAWTTNCYFTQKVGKKV